MTHRMNGPAPKKMTIGAIYARWKALGHPLTPDSWFTWDVLWLIMQLRAERRKVASLKRDLARERQAADLLVARLGKVLKAEAPKPVELRVLDSVERALVIQAFLADDPEPATED